MINISENQNINIVLPMAGAGSRFAKAGYEKPKPFIDVAGKPMIIRVMENLALPRANYILIAQTKHLEQEAGIVAQIERDYPVTFIPIDSLTEGAACTVLFAREEINNDTPLLLANSDQLVEMNISQYIEDCHARDLDGSILTFIDPDRDPKWSFAKIDESEIVSEVQEKKPISDYATVGIYYFKRGADFVNGAIDMIVRNDRTNNEFYVCPVYNHLIQANKQIGIYNIDFETMHGLGTPEDLQAYLQYNNTFSNVRV